MTQRPELHQVFSELGYAIVPSVLSADEVEQLLARSSFDVASTHSRQGVAYANRQALSLEPIQQLTRSSKVRSLAEGVLRSPCFAVRVILFDKVEGANWKIPWHQDITIGVRERHDVEGYGPWSVKEGGDHAQAPTHVLRSMVAVRLHLDDCNRENGPLRVVPGSHAGGRIKKVDIPSVEPHRHAKELTCKKGDAILMSPLTLHASSPASSPHHRRVIHIEYASCELDAPLEWANRV